MIQLFIAAGVLASIVSAAAAVDPADESVADDYGLSGYLGFNYSWVDYNDQNFNSIGGHGRATAPVGNSGSHVQLDGSFDHFDDNGSLDMQDFTVHGFWRNPMYAAGAFGGYNQYEVGNDSLESLYLGVEGQYYFDRVTLYGQVSYDRIDFGALDGDQYYGRLVGRYFATDNIKIEGEVGLGRLLTSLNDVDEITVGALAEYRFDQWPVGLFGGYYLTHFEVGPFDYEFHDFRIGGRIYFGSDSLFDNDRNGTSFDTRPTISRLVD